MKKTLYVVAVLLLIAALCYAGYYGYSKMEGNPLSELFTPKAPAAAPAAPAAPAGSTPVSPIPVIVTVDPVGEIKDLLAEVQKLETNEQEGFDASIASNPQEVEVPVSIFDAVVIDGFKKDLENEINQPTGKRGRTVDEIVRLRLRLAADGSRFEHIVCFFKGKEGANPLTPEGKLAVTTLRLSATLWGPTESYALAARLRTKFREQFPDFNFTSGIRDSSTGPALTPFTTVDE